MMQIINVNYLAVLVAAVVSFVIGWVWHSPILFGKAWMKLSNMDKKKIEAHKKSGKMGPSLFFQFVATLVTGYVLAYFVGYAGAKTAMDGAVLGFWVWLGFFATTQLGMVLWENKPFKLYLINTLHYLVTLAVMGAILAGWA